MLCEQPGAVETDRAIQIAPRERTTPSKRRWAGLCVVAAAASFATSYEAGYTAVAALMTGISGNGEAPLPEGMATVLESFGKMKRMPKKEKTKELLDRVAAVGREAEIFYASQSAVQGLVASAVA